jgi:hyperosmotically inducible protein
MKKARILSCVGALLLTAGLAAAQSNDSDIQEHLNKDLKSDKFENVQATVQNGMVTLTGTVNTYADREKAENKASSIKNVAGVRDQIEVAGKKVSDDELRKQLADKLRYDRMSYGLQVFNNLNLGVQDGYVTLTGQVRDESDRDSAQSIVAQTPGVRGVHNEITVQKNGVMDDEIRYRVARAIYGYPSLRMYAMDPQAPIRIVVENGNVSLYGYVSSEVDKNVAGMQARQVFGVKNVDNHLVTASEAKKAEKEADKH